MDRETFQQSLGIVFNDQALLEQALTHRSFINEQIEEDVEDNERLEYLGDAILGFITADMLFRRFPTMPEGELTRLRAALVRTEALALLARDVQLGDVLIMGKGEARNGGRERDNILCDAFEAVIGAIYIDQGLQVVRDFVIPRLTARQKDVMEEAIAKDPRSQFQEWSQAIHSVTPTYHTISADGPDHEKKFTVEVRVGGNVIVNGQGRSKRAAAQSAAQGALDLRDKGEIVIEVSAENAGLT